MAQRSKVIDLRRSFLPTDPNAFPENLVGTRMEDYPEEFVKVIPYEGVNFLPTDYGYRSYFGTTAELNLAALSSRCSELLMFQNAAYGNILIALCEDGIWTSNPATAAGTWTHEYTLTYDVNVFKNWTFCTLNDTLYIYREGNSVIYKLTTTPTWSSFAPSFLTMTGQKGVFRAGGRLGMWDSANSVSWSSALDYTDFTPALTTLAGNTKFRDVLGNIVSILSQSDGFVIYSTKSIVGVRLGSTVTVLWDASVISNVVGVAYPTHITQGVSDAQHFAFTNAGLYAIGIYNQISKSHAFAPLLTEVTDFIRESNNPVRLFCSEGRFLFISLIDSTYIDGVISTQTSTISEMTFKLLGYDGTTLPATLTSNQTVALMNGFLSPDNLSFGSAYGKFYGGGWDGTYSADIDNLITNVGSYFTTPNATTHWGVLFNYSPLKLEASPLSFLNAATLTVEGAWNTWDAWLSAFISAQAAFIAAKIATPAALTVETFPGVGTYPTIPADPADEIIEVGKLIVGTGKDKLIRTDANSLLNTEILRRYFTDAKRIDKRRVIHYTDWSVGNVFATWNPADKAAAVTLSGGNLIASITASSIARSTIGKSAGKWYWEVTLTNVGNNTLTLVNGVATAAADLGAPLGADAYGWGHTFSNAISICIGTATLFHGGGFACWGSNVANGDILGIALDMDIGTISLYINGVLQGLMFSGLTGTIYAAIGGDEAAPTTTVIGVANFGASAFAYSVPVGFNAGLFNTNVLQGTVTTTFEATPLTGSYGYAQTFIEALYFKKYQKDKDGNWNLLDTVNAGAATPPAFDNSYPVGIEHTITHGTSTLDNPLLSASGYEFGMAPVTIGNPYIIPASSLTVTLPGTSFNLITGTPAPLFPTYKGSLVLDIQLKKWGKFKGDHKLLLDYNPQNANVNNSVPYSDFGIRAGTLKTTGKISLFDTVPTESWLRYGKIGYYRLGMTQIHEVRADFRNISTGILEIETSLDGRNLELGLSNWDVFTQMDQIVSFVDLIGRWHTVKISGQWDLQYLEVRGTIAGRR